MCDHIVSIEITTHPSSTTVIALQDVTLTCSSSVDDVTYSWHRDGGSVPSRSTGQNSNTLTIRRATPPDEGMYYCMASKWGISVESNRAILRVDGKKSIYLKRFCNCDLCIIYVGIHNQSTCKTAITHSVKVYSNITVFKITSRLYTINIIGINIHY